MGRRKKHAEEHENLERWLVSYADFITLLFATFVVLYALSQINLAKFKQLKVSMQIAFSSPSLIQGGEGVMDKSANSILPDNGGGVETSPVQQFFDNLKAKFDEGGFNQTAKEIENMSKNKELEGIKVKVDERGLVINLLDSLFFQSGEATIRKEAYPILNKVGKLLQSEYKDKSIRVEGHTDNIPIKSALFPSNLELSAARASSVIRFLNNSYNFKGTKFAAVGYGDSIPIAPNGTEEGRKKNRRVEIVVLRDKYTGAEPRYINFEKPQPKIEKKEARPLPENLKNVSDAAKNLLEMTDTPASNLIKNQDSYEKESERLAKELELKEKGNIGIKQ